MRLEGEGFSFRNDNSPVRPRARNSGNASDLRGHPDGLFFALAAEPSPLNEPDPLVRVMSFEQLINQKHCIGVYSKEVRHGLDCL